ncbi:unnamed protein product [Candidula unifasciata]|uniref:alpha-1,2-Mannosidase n=1 Tax=Candidula unifasciata TaxID=100452 RepID=A0A8S3Z873_9EUPU|nr:unnamed protein product [Candidula unifasciata]
MKASARKFALILILLTCILLVVQVQPTESSSTVKITPEQKRELRAKSVEMFYHAYNAYMNNAYPADELMPLTCKGRYRGTEPTRGDMDDALGNFTLTLIDTLDTLAVLGDIDGFEKAVRHVIADSRFDADIVVSVFETNIRVLGGLLGGHVAASYFKRKKISMLWYHDELLTMAKEVGDRLLPAFNTTTGIPYPRVNKLEAWESLPRFSHSYRDTCTSCVLHLCRGTMILEFCAALRRQEKPWIICGGQRHRSNNLMGLVINIHNGDGVSKRYKSGVGAGIDSYYEYVLKAYVLLGDDTYLSRFNKHYDAVMRYISQGPMLVDVHMHKPTSTAKNFMDALLAFWPGLQVLVGDIGPAVETHEMLYQIVQRHNFLPEHSLQTSEFTGGQHPLRPEFLESTYFLYQATADPYYLSVGKTVLDNLEQHARVECGFAAIKDIKTGSHENQMDSFVLAETFKYLYLLFSEKEDIILDLDDFIFTTEAHLLPLTLSVGNYSWKTPSKAHPDIYKFDLMSSPGGSDYDEDRDICHNYHVTNTEGSSYPHKLRHQLRDMVDRLHPRVQTEPPRLKAADFVAGNKEHLEILRDMGIRIATMPDGRIQLLHTSFGGCFMQEMIELSKLQKQDSQHDPMYVRLMSDPFKGEVVYKAGPSQFGYNLSKNPPVQGQLAITKPFRACADIENGEELKGKIAIIERGDCMFVDKARNLQREGAIGGIVLDQAQGSSSELLSLFAMSGDGTNDITIPMVFLFWKQGHDLFETLNRYPDLLVELTSKEGVPKPAQPSSEVPTPVVSSDPASATSPAVSLPDSEHPGKNLIEETSTVEIPPLAVSTASTPPISTTSSEPVGGFSKSEHAFYHHEVLDASTRQYFLQAGTKFLHLSIEVSPREEADSEEDCRKLKYEPLPDGSKMFTFYLRHRLSGLEKPNLNEMYLDVIHSLQHHTNFEQLDQSSEYMKAIARFMESAFFSIERIDNVSLEVMRHFTAVIQTKHNFRQEESMSVGGNKHAGVSPDIAPQPATGAHVVEVSNKVLSSSIIPEASADTPLGAEGSDINTKMSHVSEHGEHNYPSHNEFLQPSQTADFTSDCSGLQSSSIEPASIEVPKLGSSDIQSSLTESHVHSESRQQSADSLHVKSNSAGSIEQKHLDPQSIASTPATYSDTQSSASKATAQPEKEEDAQNNRDEL